MKPRLIPVAILMALAATGCFETPNSTTEPTVTNNTAAQNNDDQVSVPIIATNGGEVKIGDTATLTIPPGALAEDTMITAEVVDPADVPAGAVVRGPVIDFGPDGLQFLEPVVLEFNVEPDAFTEPAAISKYEPNLGLWDQQGPTGSELEPNLGLWDQRGHSGDNYEPNLGLWDAADPDKMATGVRGFSLFAQTLPGHGVFSCGIDDTGAPCCWGLQLSECTDCLPAIDPIPTSSDFTAVSVGGWSACGLKTDGSIECFGANPPVPPAETGFVQVSAGRGHACGLKDDGTVACFMAPGLDYEVTSPTNVNIVQVTTGDFHSCARQSGGQVFCWGQDREGERGAPGGGNFVDIDAGARHTCAVTDAGALQCWGSDVNGIKRVPTGETFVEVSVGVFAACALTDTGGVICWGADYDVVTGTPTETGFTGVVANHRHACATRDDGSLECWGQAISGSLDVPAGCGIPTVQ